MGYIYLVTNLVNSKKYIGQSTSDDINTRWAVHKRVKKECLGTCLYRAYKKYGVDNFKYQIICICFDEDCNRFEEEYIRKYNTITPHGYNMKLKGGSYIVSDETRAKLSQKTKEWWETKGKYGAWKNPNKGKQLSDAQKERLRVAQKRRWALMDEETRKKQINKIQEGRQYINAETGVISRYKSEETRLNAIKGFELGRQHRLSKFKDRCVAQYSEVGELIVKYTSISEASRKSGIYRSTISKVCKGAPNSYTAGGFIWKYVDSA